MCKIIALTGPSSVGKTSLLNTVQMLANTLVNNTDLKYTRIKKVITNTDRKPRPKEEDKVDYNFLTKDKFNELIEKDKLIEYIEVPYKDTIQRYGLGKDAIDLKSNNIYLVTLNSSGIKALKKHIENNEYNIKDILTVVYINTTAEIRLNRMIKREKEQGKTIDDTKIYKFCERMIKDRDEINELIKESDIKIDNIRKEDYSKCKTFLTMLAFGLL